MAKVFFTLLFFCGSLCAQGIEQRFCAWKMAADRANATYFPGQHGDAYERFPISPLGDRVGNQISGAVPTRVVRLWAEELRLPRLAGDLNQLRELAQFAIAQRWRVGTVVPLDITQPRVAFYAGLFRAWYKEEEVRAALSQYERELKTQWAAFESKALEALREGEAPSVHFTAPYTYHWLRPNSAMLEEFLAGLRLSLLESELRAEIEATFGK